MKTNIKPETQEWADLISKLSLNDANITELYLEGEGIGGNAVQQLAKVLQKNKILKRLGITKSQIGRVGFRALEALLRINTTLLEINLKEPAGVEQTNLSLSINKMLFRNKIAFNESLVHKPTPLDENQAPLTESQARKITFFIPRNGTRQWRDVLLQPSQDVLDFLIHYEINPKDVSFLTLLPMLSPKQMKELSQQNGIFSLQNLAASLNGAKNERNSDWGRHRLRRLEAGVEVFIRAVENRSLPPSVEFEFKEQVCTNLSIVWQENNLPELIKTKINQLIIAVYQESFDGWKNFTGKIEIEVSDELQYWQGEVVNYIKNNYWDRAVLVNRLRELCAQVVLTWLHDNADLFKEAKSSLVQAAINHLIEIFEERILSDELEDMMIEKIKKLSADVNLNYPHVCQDAMQKIFVSWQGRALDDRSALYQKLLGWMTKVFSDEHQQLLPEDILNEIQRSALNQLLQEYKMQNYVTNNRPLNALLNFIPARLLTNDFVHNSNNSLSHGFFVKALNKLVDQWRSGQLEESLMQELVVFSLAPWKRGLENIQATLSESANEVSCSPLSLR